jgi:tetratricopeptide (TPR) repeat protein
LEELLAAGVPEEAEKVYRLAIATLEKLATIDPGACEPRDALARSHHGLAELLAKSTHLQEAAQAFRQAIAVWEKLAAEFSSRFEFRRELAWSYRHLADVLNASKQSGAEEKALSQAVKLFEKLGADFPERGEYRQWQGHHLWRLGAVRSATSQVREAEEAYRQAAAVFEKLAGDFPKVPFFQQELGFTYYAHLGRLLTTAKRTEDAEQAYRKAAAVHEKLVVQSPSAAYVQRLSRCYQLLAGSIKANGRSREAETTGLGALEFFEKLATSNPTLAECQEEIARLSVQVRQWDKAIDAYTHAIRLQPTSATANNNTAWLLATCPEAKFRDPGRAVALAKKAIEVNPKEGTFWNTLGAAHYRAGAWKAALAALGQSMALRKGGDSFDWFFLAMAHWQLGEKEKARTWFERAVQWMDKHQPMDEELRRFRGEATELLAVKRKM